MVKILILEDNKDTRAALEAMIHRNFEEVEVFSAAGLEEAEEIRSSCRELDLFFLDINLNSNKVDDSDGLVFAKKLREQQEYEFTPIVFITSILSLELTAYREIQCYRYITKPFNEREVTDIIHKVLNHTGNEERKSILVKKDGINYKILCDDIVYIEAISRGIRICLKDEQTEVRYMSLKQIFPKLPQNEFVQCHRMWIVNRKYVEYVDFVNQLIKLAGYKNPIEIGVTYKARIRSLLHESK